ncbi:hypothetical protein T484DRAFT_1612595, partial [Baffinella frigidus]
NPKHETRNPKPESRNPKLETRHLTPDTRNSKPKTQNPTPEIRHPTPDTRNSKLETRNPTPETRNPTPETRNTKLEILHPNPNTRHPTPENPKPERPYAPLEREWAWETGRAGAPRPSTHLAAAELLPPQISRGNVVGKRGGWWVSRLEGHLRMQGYEGSKVGDLTRRGSVSLDFWRSGPEFCDFSPKVADAWYTQ